MPMRKKESLEKSNIKGNILKSGKYKLISHPCMIRTKSGDAYDEIINHIDKILNINLNLAEMVYRIFDKYLYYLLFKPFGIIYSELFLVFDDIDDSDNRAMLNLNNEHRKELIDKIRFLFFPKDFIDHLEKGYLDFKLREKDILVRKLIVEYQMNKKSKLYDDKQLKNFQNSINVVIYLLNSKPIRRDLTEMTEQEVRIFENTILVERDSAIRNNYF